MRSRDSIGAFLDRLPDWTQGLRHSQCSRWHTQNAVCHCPVADQSYPFFWFSFFFISEGCTCSRATCDKSVMGHVFCSTFGFRAAVTEFIKIGKICKIIATFRQHHFWDTAFINGGLSPCCLYSTRSVMTLIANCSLASPAVSAPPLNASITTLRLTQSLRQRSHNFQLLNAQHTSVLRDKHFIMRMWYCDAFYWQFYLALIHCVTAFCLLLKLTWWKWNEHSGRVS